MKQTHSMKWNARYIGPGYALPTPEMIEAVRLVAQTEGILLDPVYTGKAMAGLLGLVREGFFRSDRKFFFFILAVGRPYLPIRTFLIHPRYNDEGRACVDGFGILG